ncbi:MAG: hypothetical protein KGR26_13500, partial [Cyanobacteria bacterium REEB65]|nr:hypothetical protein [Cyanobacteria bacterium REEB65]
MAYTSLPSVLSLATASLVGGMPAQLVGTQGLETFGLVPAAPAKPLPLAAEALSVVPPTRPDPWVGVRYSALGSLGLLGIGAALDVVSSCCFLDGGPGSLGMVVGTTMILAYPLGTSLGYLYAQDPWRGL